MATVSGSRLTIRLPPVSKKLSEHDMVYSINSSSILCDSSLTEAEKEKALRDMALKDFPLKPNHQPGEVDRLVRLLKEGAKMTSLGPLRAICHCGVSLSLDTRTWYAWGNWGKHKNGPCRGVLSRSVADKENVGLNGGQEFRKIGDFPEDEKVLLEDEDETDVEDLETPAARQSIMPGTYAIQHSGSHATLGRRFMNATDASGNHPLEMAEVLSELATCPIIFSPTEEDKAAAMILLSMNPYAHNRRRAARVERRYSPMPAISLRTSRDTTAMRSVQDIAA
ncbi:hypothetical protein J3R30DRAFT_3449522 [Lentinula aciculospora]|uniref:Uncharacterized protein n=1 Tax=Lentinula aciculospora TaxID=153920 RepID=A0A9W9AII1_9AGAR|nr:hypothetical protein J3R30DRAFT_3449522 [Lentinula aciculospora]